MGENEKEIVDCGMNYTSGTIQTIHLIPNEKEEQDTGLLESTNNNSDKEELNVAETPVLAK